MGPRPSIDVPPTGAPACSAVVFYTSEGSASKICIYYSIDGVAQGYKEFNAPPDIPAGTCPTDNLASAQPSSTEDMVKSETTGLDVDKLTVPSLLGKPLEQAQSEATVLGLIRVASGDGEVVTSQKPEAGSQVAPGAEIIVELDASPLRDGSGGGTASGDGTINGSSDGTPTAPPPSEG